MNAYGIDGKYESISQRVAATYRRMLAEFNLVTLEDVREEQQRDLHAFFTALYDALYTNPATFGLPVSEDIFLLTDHSKEGPNKTEVKKVLDRPRKLVEDGLQFLRSAAVSGRLDGQVLMIEPGDPALDLLKKKPGRAWVSGLGGVGVFVSDAGGLTLLTSERFPEMLPALQALARASLECENANLGRVYFARCDLRALRQDFSVDPLDLYLTLGPQDQASAMEMHTYFTARGYQPSVSLEHMHQWDVKYQGKKSVKASPLFQVIFDERLLHPMRSQIKIASAPRVAPQLSGCSPALQEDFARRVFPCQDCGWCNNRFGLQHPMVFTHQGSERKICWYLNPDIEDLDEQAIALVKEWTQFHEALEMAEKA